MQFEVPIPDGRIPSKAEVMFGHLADLMEENIKISSTFREKFIPNPAQKMVLDAIKNSEVPEGEWIHVLLYGPTGSGKSSVAYAYTIDCLVSNYNAWALGVRTTAQDIQDTIFKDTKKFLDKYGLSYTSNKQTTTFTFPNGSVFRMRSDEALMEGSGAVDTAVKLGSTAYNIAILEEANAISEELAMTLPGRMRNPGNFRKVIFYICNPPSKKHWLYRWFFGGGNDPDDPKSPYRAFTWAAEDNSEHVGTAYIAGMRRDFGRNPALARRLGYGQFGPDTKGVPYFANDFRRSVHVSDTALDWDPRYKLTRAWDFGMNPALVTFQYHPELGQYRFLRSFCEFEILLDSFCDQVLPGLWEDFNGAIWEDFGDIAGKQRSSLTKRTAYDILAERGIYYKGAPNGVMWGLNIISKLLRTSFKGNPMILIDPCCEQLIEAFESGYCNKKKVMDSDDLRPQKDGVYDHIMDATRYGLVSKRANPEDDLAQKKGFVSVGDPGNFELFRGRLETGKTPNGSIRVRPYNAFRSRM